VKRDMDLVRKILLEIEASPEDSWDSDEDFEIEGYDHETVMRHIGMLHEAGLVQALDASTMGGVAFIPRRLTWDGHEFLDAARNEQVWTRTKATIRQHGGSVPFEVMKALLVATGKSMLGLDS
jgi:acyl-CoA synthetase (AMP-forming)/AMP-acid ligase II